MTGGLALYWLAQDSALSLSDLAPGAAPLKVDTEVTGPRGQGGGGARRACKTDPTK